MQNATAMCEQQLTEGPDEFTLLVQALNTHFIDVVTKYGPELFTVDAGDLFPIYLDNLQEEHRQHHNCHCCKDFIRRFGNVVTITPNGNVVSAVWNSDTVPSIYVESVRAMQFLVERASVTGVFLHNAKVWGTPTAGGWLHFAINPGPARYSSVVPTYWQAAAAKLEDYRTLTHALGEYKRDHVAQAVSMLESGALARNEKVLGPARFLLNLIEKRAALRDSRRRRDNITWLAVARAPAGFCAPRSSMIGTLLDDIAAGLPFDDIKRRFSAKMDPLIYQRPQAAPSAGNIAQAEKLVAQLGIEPALHRRYSRIEEIEAIWKPAVPEQPQNSAGVFAHLMPKGEESAPGVEIPAQSITFEKFRRTVLPGAKKIRYLTPGNAAFGAYVTASNADAPPILQWDTEEKRNPVSWYQYAVGSTPRTWSLPVGEFVDVTAIALHPHMWADEDAYSHQGKGAMFILDGCRDKDGANLALFPEILKSELHPIRATIEAFSRAGKLSGKDEATACGLIIHTGDKAIHHYFSVTTESGVTVNYVIDRWD